MKFSPNFWENLTVRVISEANNKAGGKEND